MLKKRLESFKYAFKGIALLFQNEPNARIHLIASILVIIAGFYFHVSTTEWCLLILCIGLVLSAEAVNTAIENLTDLVSPDFHPLAGKAKDVAAAAVLLIAMSTVVVGVLIFLPKILMFFA